VTSDNASSFIGSVMEELETRMGCDRLVSDSYASWTRGSVENAGHALRNMFRALTSERRFPIHRSLMEAAASAPPLSHLSRTNEVPLLMLALGTDGEVQVARALERCRRSSSGRSWRARQGAEPRRVSDLVTLTNTTRAA
jgi:hypothetical protein